MKPSDAELHEIVRIADRLGSLLVGPWSSAFTPGGDDRPTEGYTSIFDGDNDDVVTVYNTQSMDSDGTHWGNFMQSRTDIAALIVVALPVVKSLASAELQRRQQPLPVGEGASVPAELVKRVHEAMKPSDAELKTIAERYARAYGSEESRTVVWLAKAELQRRAAPASVPAELVEQWYAAADAKRPRASDAEVLADVCAQAAAYGREQAQSGVMVSHDSWAELVARHPETMQILFGGQP